MAGSMCSRRHVWQEACVAGGHVWQGAGKCVTGGHVSRVD